MPKVSAIITTRNRLQLLRRAVESVQAQSYADRELIVVDDCSEDGTREYLQQCQAEGLLRYVRVEEGRHTNGNYARNLGASCARGEYLAYLDDDDEWLPDKLALQVGLMEAHPECGLCTGGHILCRAGRPDTVPPMDHLREGDISQYILTCIVSLTSILLFRRSVFEQVGGFDENQNFWQEYELVTRMAQVTRVCCVRQPLIRYTVDLSDRQRLTNKYTEWLATVEGQNEKFRDLIEALPPAMKVERELMIVRDALIRTENVGEMAEHKKWRRRYYQLVPGPATWICWKLNLKKASVDRIRLVIAGLKSIRDGILDR